MPESHTPWRDRPESLMKGFVAGNMVGGLGTAVLSFVFALVTGSPLLFALSFVCLGIGAFATNMWRYG